MKKRVCAALATVACLVSCQQENELKNPYEDLDDVSQKAEYYGIPADITELSPENAITVALIKQNDFNKSRAAFDNGSVKNVVTIYDKNNAPALYAVNFQDGYIIVSANKSGYPIQAEVEHGNYSPSTSIGAEQFVISELIDEKNSVQQKRTLSDLKAIWYKYESHQPNTQIKSRASMSDEAYYAGQALMTKLQKEGYQTYYLYENPEDFPSDVYEQFKQSALDDDEFANTDDRVMKTAIIAWKEEESRTLSSPKMTTLWDQEAPYNSAVSGGYYLGCGTVAVSQIMRYHKSPSSINWSAMPDRLNASYADSTLPNFLAEVRNKTMVGVDGKKTNSTTTSDINTLKSYGYSMSTSISGSLPGPIYTRGDKPGEKAGHAWLIDGTKRTSHNLIYNLYILSGGSSSYRLDDNVTRSTGVTYQYMNWGWGGDFNGWYLSSLIGENGDQAHMYTENRKFYYVISKPQ